MRAFAQPHMRMRACVCVCVCARVYDYTCYVMLKLTFMYLSFFKQYICHNLKLRCLKSLKKYDWLFVWLKVIILIFESLWLEFRHAIYWLRSCYVWMYAFKRQWSCFSSNIVCGVMSWQILWKMTVLDYLMYAAGICDGRENAGQHHYRVLVQCQRKRSMFVSKTDLIHLKCSNGGWCA